jgi:hypothetical protein
MTDENCVQMPEPTEARQRTVPVYLRPVRSHVMR